MRQKTDTLRMLLGLIAGGITLLIIHWVMNPVPVAAGPAAALGAIGFMMMGAKGYQRVINLSMLGAIIGVGIHQSWHASGSSPPPHEGLWQHLAVEGLMGWFAALFSLAVAGLVLKFLEQR